MSLLEIKGQTILISLKFEISRQLQRSRECMEQAKRAGTTAYPRGHETPFLKRNSLFPFAESRFSQPLYQ